eukprot:4526024-Alexandrium_andersonii.AAC.1
MSASLVGSEMCIRDSASCVHENTRAAQCSTMAPSSPSTRTEGHERAAAVSYTHLTLPTICSV